MDPVVIGVTGPADRLLVAGLQELSPALRELGAGATVIGGLMVRTWLHLRPVELPSRPTADIDLGINRRTLGIRGDRRVVGPLLEAQGFTPGYGGEPFRYSKETGNGESIVVDVVVAPGASRQEPPLIEEGLETISAPGLAYADLRGPTTMTLRFVDDGATNEFDIYIPPLDAALILKAALAQSGVRTRPDRVLSDSVDTIMLAAACVADPPSMSALRANCGRSDVRKGIRWLEDAFRSPTARGSLRIETYLESEGGGSGGGEWAHGVAKAFARALES